MPIPFRDQDDVDDLGLAAFLRLDAEPDRAAYRGALFQINARGEPVEFTYNRVATPNGFLWRSADLCRAAAKKLTASLLATCSQAPRLLVALAAQVPSDLFCLDLQVATPVCRLATGREPAAFSTLEVPETLTHPDPAQEPFHLFWFPDPPAAGAPARRLLRELALRGLLLEPFDRAGVGLREVLGEPTSGQP